MIQTFSERQSSLNVGGMAWRTDHSVHKGRTKLLVKIKARAVSLGATQRMRVTLLKLPTSYTKKRFPTSTVECREIETAAVPTDRIEECDPDDLVPLGSVKVTRHAIDRAKDIAIIRFPGAVMVLVTFTRQRRSLAWVVALADHIGINAHARTHARACVLAQTHILYLTLTLALSPSLTLPRSCSCSPAPLVPTRTPNLNPRIQKEPA